MDLSDLEYGTGYTISPIFPLICLIFLDIFKPYDGILSIYGTAPMHDFLTAGFEIKPQYSPLRKDTAT